MRFFRRDEPLHERLAREGGMIDPLPPWQEVGIHGIPRPRDWDATLTAEAPEIEGDAVRFVSLDDGTLLVEEGPDTSLEPLAAAIEEHLEPPYRAEAVRRGKALWAVQARRIELLALRDAPSGDVLDLSRTAEGGTTLAVDGERAFGSVPALEQRGEREGEDYAVHAERLDGTLWEIRAAAL